MPQSIPAICYGFEQSKFTGTFLAHFAARWFQEAILMLIQRFYLAYQFLNKPFKVFFKATFFMKNFTVN